MVKNVSDMTETASFYDVLKRLVFLFVLVLVIDTVAIFAGSIIPSHSADTRLAQSFIIIVSVIIALPVAVSLLRKLNRQYKKAAYLRYLASVEPALLAKAAKSSELSENSRAMVMQYLRQNHPQSLG